MDLDSLTTSTTTAIIFAAAIVTFALLFVNKDNSDIPHINPPGRFSLTAFSRIEAAKNGMQFFDQAKKRFHDIPFRMISNTGEVLILPPRFANTIRNEDGLSFSKAVISDLLGHVPGFTPLLLLEHKGLLVQNLTRKQLTKLLNSVTQPLVEESTIALKIIFGEPTEWKETLVVNSIMDLIARLSSRVFLGDKLCRNEEWLEITKGYTVDMFGAATLLTWVPDSLKFLLPIFSGRCRTVRDKMRRAQELITPIIKERRAMKEQALKEGKPIPTFNDAIEWAEAECQGYSYDPAALQLLLSFAAIHSTSDLVSKTMLLLTNDLSQITALREEIVSVLKMHGWSKLALFNMKLLDSTIKEAQRLMPIEKLSMRRIATKEVRLESENITIPKGQYVAVDATQGQNPAVFENPEKFDMYRWLRLRETEEYAHTAHFVSTSPDHLAFGHGMHACPGRFFATNEIKLALCFLLLNYDWELAPGTTLTPLTLGVFYVVDPRSTLRYKKRESEIKMEDLKFT